jgi:alanine-synthesizing transaminase
VTRPERETRSATFAAHLEQARASGRPLIDLTESDPSRCGLGWDSAELEAILGEAPAATREATSRALPPARDAVASYLAGRGASVAPDRIHFTTSHGEAHRLLLKLLCGAGDEVLVASPSQPFLDRLAAAQSLRVGRYALVYDGEWRLDRRSLARAVTRRTRAILLGNPSQPTGAILSGEDLAFLEDLCSARDIALIVDEALADTALVPSASVLQATRCLAFHVSGLSGVCGLPRLGAEWLAAAGPAALVATALQRLQPLLGAQPPLPGSVQLAIPALVARRERYLVALRNRLATNRASLAAAALRESAWSLLSGPGGCSAVLQIGAAEEEECLCLALLEDGVAVQPGFLDGFPRPGYLVVSLLPPPETFDEGLSRLDRRLRAPLFR